jgi:hypothetical protein
MATYFLNTDICSRTGKDGVKVNEETSKITFTTTGGSVQGLSGSFMRSTETRENIFDIRFTLEAHDLEEGEEFTMWKTVAPEGAQEAFDLGWSLGFGDVVSLRIGLTSGQLYLRAYKDQDSASTVLVERDFALGQEVYVRCVYNRSSNDATTPALANGRLKFSAYLDYTEDDAVLGFAAVQRNRNFWGIMLPDAVASRGGTFKLVMRETQTGTTIKESSSTATQNFIDVKPNPERVYTL